MIIMMSRQPKTPTNQPEQNHDHKLRPWDFAIQISKTCSVLRKKWLNIIRPAYAECYFAFEPPLKENGIFCSDIVQYTLQPSVLQDRMEGHR